MTLIRPTAVAGLFYPEDPQALKTMVGKLLAAVPPTKERNHPLALIAPHAGYVYSGAVAASGYRLLEGLHNQIRRVIIIGPAHRVAFLGMAIPTVDIFETPLGPMTVDQQLLARLDDLPQIRRDNAPHAPEHSLEVQLPFLLETLGDQVSIAPIVVGSTAPKAVAEVLRRIWTEPDTLLIISTDLTHFLDHDTATRIDAMTSEAIVRMEDHRIRPEHACGHIPLQGFLQVARERGMKGEILDLRNSGDTAGPRESVVGYGAYVFH